MNTHRLSLAHEIAHLARVVDGARLLADQLACDAAIDEHDQAVLPAAVSAVLILVDCRLRLLRQLLVGELPPRVLCAPHNAVGEDDASGLILCWDAERELRHAQAELERAGHAAQRVTEGQ